MANDLTGPGDHAATSGKTVKVWIEPDPSAPEGCGRVMILGEAAPVPQGLAAFTIPILSRIFGVLSPNSPKVANNFAVASGTAANDNKGSWLGAHDDDAGFFASDVDAATLADGSTVVAWIGDDQIIHAKLVDDRNVGQAETAELDKLLADLGEAGQVATSGPGRLKLITLGNNGFAALWIADFGLTAALIGKAFLSQIPAADAHEADTARPSWTAVEIAPVSIPQASKALAVALKPDGGVAVTVVAEAMGESSAGNPAAYSIDLTMLVGDEEGGEPDVHFVEFAAESVPADPAPTTEVRHSSGSSLASGIESGATTPDAVVAGAAAQSGNDSPATIELPQPLKGDSGHQPIVVVTEGGTPVVLAITPGAEPGQSILTAQFLGPDGQTTHATVITERAITADPAQPNADLQPAVAASGSGISAVWIEAADSQSAEPPALKLQGLGGDGAPVAAEPVTIVVLAGDVVSVSGMAIASLGARAEPAGSTVETAGTSVASVSESSADSSADAGAASEGSSDGRSASEVSSHDGSESETATADYELAVVWVQNADSSGYGEIMAQRFAVDVPEDDKSGSGDGQGSIVALGCDGEDGAGSDAAFAVGTEGAEGSGAIGRAPTVAEAGDDDIVVTWVAQADEDTAREVVRGVVLSEDTGLAVAVLDLGALMSSGIVAGTDPTVLATDEGHILVAWLQNSANGGYDEAGAVYEHVTSGLWLEPQQVVLLSHFDTIPDNLQISLTDGENPEIVVSWQEGRRTITGEHFSLDGISTGEDFSYRIDKCDDQPASSAADDGLSAALLPDGQLLVVYSDDASSVGVSAVVVDLETQNGQSETSNSGPSSETTTQVVDFEAMQLVQIDAESDLILINFDALDVDATSSSNSGSGSSGSGSGSSGSGSSGSGSSGSSGSWSSDVNDGDDLSGSRGSSGSGSSGSDESDDGALIFISGYGNDVADYVEEDHLFDDLGSSQGDPLADAFDALQFANALSDTGNMEVITFDATNVVVIRDFETL